VCRVGGSAYPDNFGLGRFGVGANAATVEPRPRTTCRLQAGSASPPREPECRRCKTRPQPRRAPRSRCRPRAACPAGTCSGGSGRSGLRSPSGTWDRAPIPTRVPVAWPNPFVRPHWHGLGPRIERGNKAQTLCRCLPESARNKTEPRTSGRLPARSGAPQLTP
jgi:hypothetical protein